MNILNVSNQVKLQSILTIIKKSRVFSIYKQTLNEFFMYTKLEAFRLQKKTIIKQPKTLVITIAMGRKTLCIVVLLKEEHRVLSRWVRVEWLSRVSHRGRDKRAIRAVAPSPRM